MEKLDYFILAYMLLQSTFVITYCNNLIQSKNKLKDSYLVTLERMKQNGVTDESLKNIGNLNLITDLVFVDYQSECPTFYQQMLPFGLCDSFRDEEDLTDENQAQLKRWREHCYKSESDIDYLTLNNENTPISTTKYFKICSKQINPSDYRVDFKSFNFRSVFSKMCAYQDTSKRGYVAQKNHCSLNSSKQICQPDQFLYKSQFMIACLDNESTEAAQILKTVITCTQDEIACTISSRFYCIKNSEKCPIVDVKVNAVSLSLLKQGYDGAKVEEINGYSYLKRNDILEDMIIGLDIIEIDKTSKENAGNNIIIVKSEDSKNKENRYNNSENALAKIVQISHEEINWIDQNRFNQIQSSLNRLAFICNVYLIFQILVSGITLGFSFHCLLKPKLLAELGYCDRNVIEILIHKHITSFLTFLLAFILMNLIFTITKHLEKGKHIYAGLKINNLDQDFLKTKLEDEAVIFLVNSFDGILFSYLNWKLSP